jgi:hypothetical protein
VGEGCGRKTVRKGEIEKWLEAQILILVVGILHISYLLDVLSSYSLADVYLRKKSAKVLH